MSDLKIAVPGQVFFSELTTVQVPIALGASGALANVNGVTTITFTAAHGLTATPAAGTAPNFFGTFNGVTGSTGVGTLNGPIFRIISIPSTTTIQIYSTVLTATMTAANFVPIFIPTGAAQVGSIFVGGPTAGSPLASVPGPLQATANINYLLGPNCTIQYNPDNTSIIQDQTTLNAGSAVVGQTLATSPTFRIMGAASAGGQQWFDGVGQTAIFASGGAGTSRWSVIE